MTAVFTNESTLVFKMNGIDKPKNYVAIVNGNNVMIINTYDSKDVLLKSTPYNEIEVSGVVHDNVIDTANALTPLLFAKQILSLSGASESTSNSLKFHNAVEGVIHGDFDNPITGDLTIDETGAVPGGFVTVVWSGSNLVVNGNNVQFRTGVPDTAGVYEIGLTFFGGKYNVYVPNANGVPTGGDTTAPSLSNFRILNTFRDRVYFDTDEAVTATTFDGFTIASPVKTVTAIFISSGNTTGHYFTLDSDFIEADSPTIAYDGSDDVADISTGQNQLAAFSATSITNNVTVSALFEADFTGLSAGAYTNGAVANVNVSDGAPQIATIDGGSKLSGDGDDAVEITTNIGALVAAQTAVELLVHNVKLTAITAQDTFFGFSETSNQIVLWVNANGSLDGYVRIDGANVFLTNLVPGTLVANTIYPSLGIRMENEGADVRVNVLVNGASIGNGLVSGKQLSQFAQIANFKILTRNTASNEFIEGSITKFDVKPV